MTQNKKVTKLIVSLLCTSFLVSASLQVIRAEDEDLTNQLSGIEQKMQEAQNKKANAEATIGTVSEQLRQVQIELDQATNELKSIEKQLHDTQIEIDKNEKLLKEAEARLKQRENVFNKRVRDIYINGQLSYLDVIIGSKDFSDFANRLEILKRIIDSDITLINSIKKEREDINARKAKLEEDKAKIVVLQKAAKEKQALVEQKKQERTVVLQRAMNDRDAAMQAYNDMQASSNSIKAVLQQREAARRAAAAAAAASSGSSASSTEYVQGTGQLAWPANGPITSPFGWRTHPIFGRQIFHSGIDIGIDEGTPVHAADRGTVVSAGWMDGYGNVVVVDHGNGLSTLYAHNSEITVSEGQVVNKGQTVAISGNTGNSTGAHLHFEVRSGGEPVNPMGYL